MGGYRLASSTIDQLDRITRRVSCLRHAIAGLELDDFALEELALDIPDDLRALAEVTR